jgi:hypothetical protein
VTRAVEWRREGHSNSPLLGAPRLLRPRRASDNLWEWAALARRDAAPPAGTRPRARRLGPHAAGSRCWDSRTAFVEISHRSLPLGGGHLEGAVAYGHCRHEERTEVFIS